MAELRQERYDILNYIEVKHFAIPTKNEEIFTTFKIFLKLRMVLVRMNYFPWSIFMLVMLNATIKMVTQKYKHYTSRCWITVWLM